VGGARLRRALSLRDLIIYGVIVISPTAPMTFFGILSARGHGHAASTILIAMFAMLLTAISYGRMARAYPSAGSGFTYVGREIGPAWGYVTGWSMVLDYLMQPIINVIFCSQQSHVLFPGIDYWVWAILFTLLFSALNVQGIKMSARFNAGRRHGRRGRGVLRGGESLRGAPRTQRQRILHPAFLQSKDLVDAGDPERHFAGSAGLLRV
jgi:amino acid transporter